VETSGPLHGTTATNSVTQKLPIYQRCTRIPIQLIPMCVCVCARACVCVCACVCVRVCFSHFKDMSPFRRPSECCRKQETLIIHLPATTKRVKCKQSSDTGTHCCLQHRSKLVKIKTEGPDTTWTVRHAYCMGQQRGFTDCIVVVIYGVFESRWWREVGRRLYM
jgi:hypothetical protein